MFTHIIRSVLISHLIVAAVTAQEVRLAPENRPRCRLIEIFDRYVVEHRGPDNPGAVDLVAEGRGEDRAWTIARTTLHGVRREATAHRRFRFTSREWVSCWRLVARTGRSVGCFRRRVHGNDHPVPTEMPTVRLAFTWSFDLSTQRFVITPDPAAELPVPRPLAARPAGLAFHIPLPLERHTTAVAKRALRSAGATLTPTPDAADVLVLPDSVDFCMYDRRSQPRGIAPLLPGRRVLAESSLDALRR